MTAVKFGFLPNFMFFLNLHSCTHQSPGLSTFYSIFYSCCLVKSVFSVSTQQHQQPFYGALSGTTQVSWYQCQ